MSSTFDDVIVTLDHCVITTDSQVILHVSGFDDEEQAMALFQMILMQYGVESIH